MDNIEISIFDTQADDIAMPGTVVNIDNAEISGEDIKNILTSTGDVISRGIEDALTGDTIKSVIVPEESDITLPNYVIDLSEVSEICEIHSTAIDALLNEDGDTAVYVYTNTGIDKIGMGYGELLNRIIAPAISNIFNDKCLIYKNYQIGEDLDIVDGKDISNLRLSI